MFPNSYPKSPHSHESHSHSDTAGCKCCLSETLAIPGKTYWPQNLRMNVFVFQVWKGFAISIAQQVGQGDPGLIKSLPGPGAIEQTSLLMRTHSHTHTYTYAHTNTQVHTCVATQTQMHSHVHACINMHISL